MSVDLWICAHTGVEQQPASWMIDHVAEAWLHAWVAGLGFGCRAHEVAKVDATKAGWTHLAWPNAPILAQLCSPRGDGGNIGGFSTAGFVVLGCAQIGR